MSKSSDVIWSIVYMLLLVSCSILNGLVLTAVFKYRFTLLKKKRLYIIYSLAASDLLKIIAMVFQVIAVICGPSLETGRTACIVSSSATIVVTAVTAVHLAAESINRLVSIVWPLRYESFLNSRLFRAILPVIWLAPILGIVVTPAIIFRADYTIYHTLRSSTYACVPTSIQNSTESQYSRSAFKKFALSISLLFFVIPFAMMVISYSVIFKISLAHICQIKRIERHMAQVSRDRRRSSVISGAAQVSVGSQCEMNGSVIHVRVETCTESAMDLQNANNKPATSLTPCTQETENQSGQITNALKMRSLSTKHASQDATETDPVFESCVVEGSRSIVSDVASSATVSNHVDENGLFSTNSQVANQNTGMNRIPMTTLSSRDESATDALGPYSFIKEFSVMAAWAEMLRRKALEGDTTHCRNPLSQLHASITTELKVKRREIQLARTLGGLLGAFIIFYLPLLVFSLNNVVSNNELTNSSYDLGRFFVAFTFLNATINPIIYSLKVTELRNSIKKLIECTKQHIHNCCCNRKL
eukprot:gene16086-17709_t